MAVHTHGRETYYDLGANWLSNADRGEVVKVARNSHWLHLLTGDNLAAHIIAPQLVPNEKKNATD